jgi:hypothetical protein
MHSQKGFVASKYWIAKGGGGLFVFFSCSNPPPPGWNILWTPEHKRYNHRQKLKPEQGTAGLRRTAGEH